MHEPTLQTDAELRHSRTVVLGLGNPVLMDDAAGLEVVSRLKELLESDPIQGVDVLASTRAGFELIDMLHDYARAIIVDALDMPEGEPGHVVKLDLTNCAGSSRLNSQHELSLPAVFELAEKLGIEMPSSVRVFGIEAADVRTFAEKLTPEVWAAISPLAVQIHCMLKNESKNFEHGADSGNPAPPAVFYPPSN